MTAMADTPSAANMPAMDPSGAVTTSAAHDAAAKKFDSVDTEHTGKIDEATAQSHNAGPMFKAIHEMDKTNAHMAVDRKEYMAGVDAAFQEADGDHEGKLSPTELKTPAGQRFLKLVE